MAKRRKAKGGGGDDAVERAVTAALDERHAELTEEARMTNELFVWPAVRILDEALAMISQQQEALVKCDSAVAIDPFVVQMQLYRLRLYLYVFEQLIVTPEAAVKIETRVNEIIQAHAADNALPSANSVVLVNEMRDVAERQKTHPKTRRGVNLMWSILAQTAANTEIDRTITNAAKEALQVLNPPPPPS